MILFLPLTVFLSLAAQAAKPAKIDVRAELLINGKVVTNPRIIALPGEPAELRQSDRSGKTRTVFSVTAQPADAKMEEIRLDMDLEYAAGDRIIHSRPQVIAKAGDEALMTLEESTKSEKIQLRVRARPQ